MRIKKSTIESNVRMTKTKVTILDALAKEHPDLTQAEWEVVLAEMAQDAARYRLREDRGKDTED